MVLQVLLFNLYEMKEALKLKRKNLKWLPLPTTVTTLPTALGVT